MAAVRLFHLYRSTATPYAYLNVEHTIRDGTLSLHIQDTDNDLDTTIQIPLWQIQNISYSTKLAAKRSGDYVYSDPVLQTLKIRYIKIGDNTEHNIRIMSDLPVLQEVYTAALRELESTVF